jgi:hypothetical protein
MVSAMSYVGWGHDSDLCLQRTIFQVHLYRFLTMTKRPLLLLVLVAAAMLAGLNVAMAALSHRLPYRLKLDSIAGAHAPNLLLLGNSLLDHHLDEGALTAEAVTHGVQITPLNAALGASEPPEQRLIFDYAVRRQPAITTLVVGFYDFQLTDPNHSRVADLTGNRMVGMDRRFPFAEVVEAYGLGVTDRDELALLRAMPMAANRASAWKNVELLRRSMASIGMPAVATNSMGRVNDFAALEAGSPQVFDSKAQRFLSDPGHFNASYEAIFAEARKAKMHVVIVAMPMSPSHLGEFYARPMWGSYLQVLKQLAATQGINVIDASRWMTHESDFVDHLHMTQEAARQFSIRLGDELPEAIGRETLTSLGVN